MAGHVHLYEEYDPDRYFAGIVVCMQESDTPVLEVGDTVQYGGAHYEALPTFVGSVLKVERDASKAQVAIQGKIESVFDEARELVGAGYTSGVGQFNDPNNPPWPRPGGLGLDREGTRSHE